MYSGEWRRVAGQARMSAIHPYDPWTDSVHHEAVTPKTISVSPSDAQSIMKQRVLFLCTHNSARSQMAEGFLRRLAGERFEVASAGIEKTEVRPEAIAAMAQHGVDIRDHTSKTLTAFLGEPWDYVITVCDQANEACPVFPGAKNRLHWSFEDPSRVHGPERQVAFDLAADRIEQRVREWLAEIG
jgi:arsenate reductase